MDKIFIKDLVIKTLIGVDEDERRQEQEVIINITLELDLSLPSASDNLDDTIDYRDLVSKIKQETSGTVYILVEALAEMIAQACLDEEGVKRVTVSVEKVGSVEHVGRVGVEIVRVNP